MFPLEMPKIREAVSKHVLRRVPGGRTIVDAMTFTDTIQAQLNAKHEIQAIQDTGMYKLSSLAPYLKMMLERTKNWPGFEMPALYESKNACREVWAEWAYANELNELRTVGMGHGSPYPKLITNRQCAHIGRQLWQIVHPVHRNTVVILMLGVTPLNKKKRIQLAKTCHHPLAREIVFGFYNQNRLTNWWGWIEVFANQFFRQEDRDAFASTLGDLIFDAIGLGEEVTIKAEHRTSTVMGLLKDMRARDDFSNMPILADALQDAGYDNEKFLEYYRHPDSKFSAGSWIFKKVGLL